MMVLGEPVRRGNLDMHGHLCRRCGNAARNLACQVSCRYVEADDLVAETFVRVLVTLRTGRGTNSVFRACLVTTLRHTAYGRARRDREVDHSDDVSTAGEVSVGAVGVPFVDTVIAVMERSLTVSTVVGRVHGGLRQAYVQAQFTQVTERRCHVKASRIGIWTRNSLSARVEAHGNECGRRRTRAGEFAADPRTHVPKTMGRARRAVV